MKSVVVTRLLLCCLLAVISGCAEISRSGPAERAINAEAADVAGFTLLEMNAENVGNYRVEQSSDSAGTAGIPSAPQISLRPGDVLKVKISESKEGGLFAPLALGGTAFENVRVDHNGTISLPYAGRVKVAGLDPPRVEDRVRARLAGVTFEPQVYVELVSDRGSSVLVGGAVKTPGRFSMLEGPMTLIDAISKAGGPATAAHQTDVVIRHGSKVARIPLSDVEDGRNVQLRAGDEVMLEANAKVFNALGTTVKTGQIEFTKAHMSLLDALSLAGGLDSKAASNKGVFVFRLREAKAWRDVDGKWQEGPVIFKFDMSKPETMFIAQAFGVKPNDTVYVTTAPAVEWVRALAPIAITLQSLSSAANAGQSVDRILSGN